MEDQILQHFNELIEEMTQKLVNEGPTRRYKSITTALKNTIGARDDYRFYLEINEEADKHKN